MVEQVLSGLGPIQVPLRQQGTGQRRHGEQAEARQIESAAAAPMVVSRPEPAPAVVAQVRSALESGELKCSKRKVAEALSLSLEEVDRVFHHLLAEGVLGQGSNRHYHLSSQAG